MAIDVGTGDGRAVLATAAGEPETLVIGLDANAAGMAEVRASGSTWARRLGSQRPTDRRVMLMRLVRPHGAATSVGGLEMDASMGRRA